MLAALVVLSATVLAHPSSELGLPFLRNYSPRDYRAHPQNWDIVQDHRGVMYFANTSGVLEYDGVEWRLIRVANESVVRSLAVDEDGTIWVGAHSELGYLEPDASGSLSYVSLRHMLPADVGDFGGVWRTYCTPEGVYFFAGRKLMRWDGGAFTTWDINARSMLSRVGNQIYHVENEVGLQRMGESLELVQGGEQFTDKGTVFFMLPLEGDAVLIGSDEDGLEVFDPRSGTIADPSPISQALTEFVGANPLYCGAFLASGHLALGTRGGGAITADRAWNIVLRLGRQAGLMDQAVWSLLGDQRQGLWLALNNGIARAEVHSQVTVFDERTGLRGSVNALARCNAVLYAATNLGVYYLEGGGFHQVRAADGEYMCLLSFVPPNDPATARLLAGNTTAIHEIRSDGPALIAPQKPVFTMYTSRLEPSRVWVGLIDGLASLRYEDGRWIAEGRVEGINAPVRALVEDSAGSLWIQAAHEGVIRVRLDPAARLDRAAVDFFSTEHGLPDARATVVAAFDGRPLFATPRGLLTFDAATGLFTPDTSVAALLGVGEASVGLFVQSNTGDCWMRISRDDRNFTVGVVKQRDGSYRQVVEPLRRLPRMAVYALLPEEDGVVWIGGPEGLFRYDGRVTRDFDAPFDALIRRVTRGDGSVLFGGAFSSPSKTGRSLVIAEQPESQEPVLRYEENSIVFHFAAPSYDHEEANRYRYWLEGFDRGWSQWSAATSKEYTNLGEGRYVFKVTARNAYGTESVEAAYEFTVLAPWYRTAVAYLAYALAFVAVFYCGIELNSRRLRRANIRLERLVQERTCQLKERNLELRTLNEQKDEFLGIAAHDLRSPLASVTSHTDLLLHFLRIGRRDSELWERFLGNIRTISEQMRALVDELLDVTAIESGRLELHITRFAFSETLHESAGLHGQAAEAKGIDLVVDRVSADVEVMADRARVIQVLDNLVTNAIKFTHSGGKVRVHFEVASSEAIVHVEDTGQGLDETELDDVFSGKKLSARPTGGETSTGLGLVIVRKILDLHGCKLWVKSDKGVGSTFSFSLPLAGCHPPPEPAGPDSVPDDPGHRLPTGKRL